MKVTHLHVVRHLIFNGSIAARYFSAMDLMKETTPWEPHLSEGYTIHKADLPNEISLYGPAGGRIRDVFAIRSSHDATFAFLPIEHQGTITVYSADFINLSRYSYTDMETFTTKIDIPLRPTILKNRDAFA